MAPKLADKVDKPIDEIDSVGLGKLKKKVKNETTSSKASPPYFDALSS